MYGFASAKQLKAQFKCHRCKKMTWSLLHVEYTAFSFDAFGRCEYCGLKNEVQVHTI